eukprot:9488623-Pyramimonas_sp.AAC.1
MAWEAPASCHRTLRIERDMLQVVTSAPRFALPSPFICSLRSLGLSLQSRCLEHAGRAALFHAAEHSK